MHCDQIYTVGHSNRSAEDFLHVMSFHGMQVLVDVRARLYSGRFPHFNMDTLRQALQRTGVTYHWAGRQLGGQRVPRPDSPKLALTGTMRGYADYI